MSNIATSIKIATDDKDVDRTNKKLKETATNAEDVQAKMGRWAEAISVALVAVEGVNRVVDFLVDGLNEAHEASKDFNATMSKEARGHYLAIDRELQKVRDNTKALNNETFSMFANFEVKIAKSVEKVSELANSFVDVAEEQKLATASMAREALLAEEGMYKLWKQSPLEFKAMLDERIKLATEANEQILKDQETVATEEMKIDTLMRDVSMHDDIKSQKEHDIMLESLEAQRRLAVGENDKIMIQRKIDDMQLMYKVNQDFIDKEAAETLEKAKTTEDALKRIKEIGRESALRSLEDLEVNAYGGSSEEKELAKLTLQNDRAIESWEYQLEQKLISENEFTRAVDALNDSMSDKRIQLQEKEAKKIMASYQEITDAVGDAFSSTLGFIDEDLQDLYVALDNIVVLMQKLNWLQGVGGIFGMGNTGGAGGAPAVAGAMSSYSSSSSNSIGSLTVNVSGGSGSMKTGGAVQSGVMGAMQAVAKQTLADEMRYGGALRPQVYTV